jgi:hypothetical protein
MYTALNDLGLLIDNLNKKFQILFFTPFGTIKGTIHSKSKDLYNENGIGFVEIVDATLTSFCDIDNPKEYERIILFANNIIGYATVEK